MIVTVSARNGAGEAASLGSVEATSMWFSALGLERGARINSASSEQRAKRHSPRDHRSCRPHRLLVLALQSHDPSRHCSDCRASNGKPHTAACHPSSISDAVCRDVIEACDAQRCGMVRRLLTPEAASIVSARARRAIGSPAAAYPLTAVHHTWPLARCVGNPLHWIRGAALAGAQCSAMPTCRVAELRPRARITRGDQPIAREHHLVQRAAAPISGATASRVRALSDGGNHLRVCAVAMERAETPSRCHPRSWNAWSQKEKGSAQGGRKGARSHTRSARSGAI
jgi:hypothetical protein